MESPTKRPTRLKRPDLSLEHQDSSTHSAKRKRGDETLILDKKKLRFIGDSRLNNTRKLPPGGYGLHDGGVVTGISEIAAETDWLSVKQSLTEALEIGEDAVVYATRVQPDTMECYALLKPFENDLSTCQRLSRISVGKLKVLDGLELAAAVRSFPAHIQRLRETRASACAKARRA